MMMKCFYSGEQLERREMNASSESLATRDFSASGYSSRPGDPDPKLDNSNIEEAESSLRESGFLNYENKDDEFVDDTQKKPIEVDSQDEEVPLKSKKRKTEDANERAPCWNSFEKVMITEDDGVTRKYGKCKYCASLLKADPQRNGTSALNKHVRGCKKHPNNLEVKKQSTLAFKKDVNGEGSIGTWKHDDARIKKAFLNLFIVGELPFKFVENEAFIEYTNALNNKFVLPSRHKVSKDVAKFYIEQRGKLFAILSNPKTAVHLTTDTWTSSCQRVNYMVVTAHFIDENWEMHKRIINFRVINSHRGEDIARELLDCIRGWGIKNVMTMTVDNATSNDKAIEYLIKKLPNLYDSGKHFHIRCMAHILNLIVKDGLKFNNFHVECVQKAVRYIRNSTQRIIKFKLAIEERGLETKKFLCGDTPTRWNSTFELLKTAYDLRDAFYEYSAQACSNEDIPAEFFCV